MEESEIQKHRVVIYCKYYDMGTAYTIHTEDILGTVDDLYKKLNEMESKY